MGFIIYPYIGPVAQAEDKDLPEEEKPSSKETVLKIERWDLVIIALESMAMMKTSSARLSQGPRRWFISKDDNLENSVGVDKHLRDIR